jgi:hypothetical protein
MLALSWNIVYLQAKQLRHLQPRMQSASRMHV